MSVSSFLSGFRPFFEGLRVADPDLSYDWSPPDKRFRIFCQDGVYHITEGGVTYPVHGVHGVDTLASKTPIYLSPYMDNEVRVLFGKARSLDPAADAANTLRLNRSPAIPKPPMPGGPTSLLPATPGFPGPATGFGPTATLPPATPSGYVPPTLPSLPVPGIPTGPTYPSAAPPGAAPGVLPVAGPGIVPGVPAIPIGAPTGAGGNVMPDVSTLAGIPLSAKKKEKNITAADFDTNAVINLKPWMVEHYLCVAQVKYAEIVNIYRAYAVDPSVLSADQTNFLIQLVQKGKPRENMFSEKVFEDIIRDVQDTIGEEAKKRGFDWHELGAFFLNALMYVRGKPARFQPVIK